MTEQSLDVEGVREHLRKVKRLSGITDQQMADQYGICQSYMSKVLAGDADPGEKLLSALGLRKLVRYEWTRT